MGKHLIRHSGSAWLQRLSVTHTQRQKKHLKTLLQNNLVENEDMCNNQTNQNSDHIADMSNGPEPIESEQNILRFRGRVI